MKLSCVIRLAIALAVLGFESVSFAQSDAPEASAGLDAATLQEFDRLDRDRSGGLDEREFGFSTVVNRLHEAGKNRLVPRVFSQIDEDDSKAIEILELARSQLNRNTRLLDGPQNKQFILSDIDLDGFIEIIEYRQRPDSDDAIFNKIDLNKSGKIGPYEWLCAVKKRDASMDVEQEHFFASLDRDDNGALTLEELKHLSDEHPLSGRFESIDLNGNRELGPTEYFKALANPEAEPRVPEHVADSFRRLDRNRDNALSMRELSRSPAMQKGNDRKGGRVGVMFENADGDGDNELSLEEFQRMMTRFRRQRR